MDVPVSSPNEDQKKRTKNIVTIEKEKKERLALDLSKSLIRFITDGFIMILKRSRKIFG